MEVDSFYLLTSGDMHEHLELGALLGEMAQMLHPHHVYIQRNIISAIHVYHTKIFMQEIMLQQFRLKHIFLHIIIDRLRWIYYTVLPFVEVGGCSNVDNDVDVVGQLLQHRSLQTQVLVDDVSSQSNKLLLDQLLESLAAVPLPQQVKQLRVNHLHIIIHLNSRIGLCCLLVVRPA
jgi:hypothetical protein